MKKIEIRGIIVPPEFEDSTLDDFIQKGLFTPTSKVERELAEAEKNGEPVRLYVNSEGGDVLAGNALLDRIRSFPHGLTVECGAIVASEAANIVAQLADSRPILCHPNTIFLWHSARSEIEAGPDALRDEARFLDLVNAPIKAILIAHGVPPYSVERGFSEGREYLMSAEEALGFGIVSRIIGTDAGGMAGFTRQEADTILSAVNSRFPLAAYADAPIRYSDMAKRNAKKTAETLPEEEEKKTETTETVETEEVKTEETKVDETPATEEKTEETETKTEEEKTEEANPEPEEETEDARRIRELEEKVETLTQELDALREENARKSEEANAARTEAKANASTVATLRAELAASEKRRNALVGRVLSNAGDGSTSEPRDWREAVKACGSPALAFDKYPHLARAWRDSH